jgi:competence protein CoiA
MKTKIALKDDIIVGIDDVENGLNCKCICIDCGEKLIARNNGKKRRHHFAHKHECSGNIETYLHKVAKEIIKKNKKIKLPNGEIYNYITIEFEKSYKDIRPDVIIRNDNSLLFVEIAVTHFIDDIKKTKIELMEIPTIEIDLSSFTYNSSLDEIEKAVIHKIDYKKYIWNYPNPEIEDHIIDEISIENSKIETNNHINGTEKINFNQTINTVDVKNFLFTILGIYLIIKVIKWFCKD